METKRNLKYFTSTGPSLLVLIGLAIIVVGVVMMMFPFMRMLGIIVAIVGLVVVVFGSGGKASGDDIEYQAGEKIKNMHEQGMIRFELFEKSLKYLRPLAIRGYEFDDSVYYKKGSDGQQRTSIFSSAILFFTGEKICIHRKRFSFVDENLDEEIGGAYKYIDLDHAEIRDFMFERQVGKRLVKFRVYKFAIVAKDGSDVLDMCVDYGADIDKACEDINRIIKIRTTAYYEKVARMEAERKERMEAAENEKNAAMA